jgi:hypothetical protein
MLSPCPGALSGGRAADRGCAQGARPGGATYLEGLDTDMQLASPSHGQAVRYPPSLDTLPRIYEHFVVTRLVGGERRQRQLEVTFSHCGASV